MTAVTYRLQPTGWPVMPRIPVGPCWWCAEPHNGQPEPGNSCPVRHVPIDVLSPERRVLRWVLS